MHNLPTTEGSTTMYRTPNQDTLQGRQLAGLLASKNRGAKMLLTVDLRAASGSSTYHQTFRAKAWTGRNGNRMLTLDLGDSDWASGQHATKVLHVDTTNGTARPAYRMQDKLAVYAAQAAVRWAFTGQAPQPRNGSVAVQAARLCGCCGRELTHPTSLELGIGPECASKLGLQHHYSNSKTLAGTAAKRAAQAAPAAQPAAPAPAAPTAADSHVAAGLAEWVEANQDVLARMGANSRAVVLADAEAALRQGRNPAWLDIFGAPVLQAEADEWAATRAALRQAEADMQRAVYRRDAAMRRNDWDAAQQAADMVDTYRGMATKLKAELVGNGQLVPA